MFYAYKLKYTLCFCAMIIIAQAREDCKMKHEFQITHKGNYDVIVVGAGPAGIAAAISASTGQIASSAQPEIINIYIINLTD